MNGNSSLVSNLRLLGPYPTATGLILTALLSLASTSRAQASCGDYLHVKLAPFRIEPNTVLASKSRVTEPSTSSRPVACRGAACRRQFPLPQASIPIKISPRVDEYAVHTCELDSPTPRALFPLRLVADVPSDGYPTFLKRPPRR